MSKRKFVAALFVVFIIAINAKAKTVYVSSSHGQDANDGSSMKAPMRRIGEAIENADTIYLAAGDVFYEYVEIQGKTLTRFGEGPNPKISGLRYLAKGQWKSQGNDVWILDLTVAHSDGFIVSGSSELNNIGCLYEWDKDILHGRKCPNLSDLKFDWDFYQTDLQNYKMNGNASFDKLYLFYSGNPNNLDISLSVGSHYGIYAVNSTIEHVNVEGFGTGGINLTGTCNVRGCRIDIIGGSMMLSGKSTISLGNGVDFWLNRSAKNCKIEDNYISRCFDCGGSIQIIGFPNAIPSNIVFRNNLISRCCQGWEDFLCNGKTGPKYDNCRFENNIVVYSGQSGFGYYTPRIKYCNVLDDNLDGPKGMIIRNNIFVGGNYYCGGPFEGKYQSNIWEGNIHYISRGSYILNNQHGHQDGKLWIPDEGSYKAIVSQYRKLTNDYTTRFKICSHSTIKKRSEREIKKYLRKHSY